MPTRNVYLFSLVMGLVSVFMVYCDSYQNQDKKPRCSYIKVFIGGSIVSLITALYFTQGLNIFSNKASVTSSNVKMGGSAGFPEVSMSSFPPQQIMTGSPDF